MQDGVTCGGAPYALLGRGGFPLARNAGTMREPRVAARTSPLAPEP